MHMRVLIVGGVAGGMSAAARLRRIDESAEIVVFERGPHVSFANCGLPYFASGVIADREQLLVQTPERLRARLALDVRVRHEVRGLDPARRVAQVYALDTGTLSEEPFDYLLLSPGAGPVRPPLPGIDHPRIFTLRNIPDVDQVAASLAGAQRAVVVGGGFIGVEMAEALVHRKIATTLVELAPQILTFVDPDVAAFGHAALRRAGVDLRLATGVASFADRDGGVDVHLSDGAVVPSDLVIFAVGVAPEARLAKEAGLTLGKTGGIWVDDTMRTSDARIFAVGDAIEVTHFVTEQPARIPLAGPANRQGRIAADNILAAARNQAPSQRYARTQGTGIVQVIDTTIAGTGATSAQLQREQRPFGVASIHAGHHASYYPGAETLHLKVLFDPTSGKLLGAQAAGRAGADKRIDVLATAIRHGATVMDLEHYELCYAPPYGSAKDPVNMIGFVASNHLRGDAPLVAVDGQGEQALATWLARGATLLDVRTREEFASGTMPHALNIPVDELRQRWQELDLRAPVVTYCAVGLRGYLAQRMLLQHGFVARNLSGGFATWRAAHDQA